MKITDIETTLISILHLCGFQDATVRHPEKGYTVCFVHILTDSGHEGLAPGRGGVVTRELVEGNPKKILLGRDALQTERLWDDMFWRLRGVGRKGVALCALSAVDIALWDLKAKLFGLPIYKLLGEYTEGMCPITEEALTRMVTFSFNENYTEEDIADIAQAIRKVAEGLR